MIGDCPEDFGGYAWERTQMQADVHLAQLDRSAREKLYQVGEKTKWEEPMKNSQEADR